MKSLKMLALALSVFAMLGLAACSSGDDAVSDISEQPVSAVATSTPSDIDLTGSNAVTTSSAASTWSEPEASGSDETLTEDEQSSLKEQLINEINSLMED